MHLGLQMKVFTCTQDLMVDSLTLPARLHEKTKVRKVLINMLLFADDAAFVAHSEQELQSLMDRFSLACVEFNLTISLKKTTVIGQNTPAPPTISIGNYNLEVVEKFCYLGSTSTVPCHLMQS